jgi:4'-phosphopantetheinyl transferase
LFLSAGNIGGRGFFMVLYLYYNENKGERQSESLVRKALSDYCMRQLPEIPAESLAAIEIAREEKGKPFFQKLPADRCGRIPQVHFSVSHSGNWWGCLMADEPVGFDIEVCRDKVSHEKIAGRFFTEAEADLILAGGPDVFFDVWVRKEAYLKYLGTGLAGGLDSFTVAENGRLLDQVKECFIRPVKIGDGVKASYCSCSGDPVKAVVSLE